MAKLRRFRAYRRIERPYTRISRSKKKNYIRISPPRKVVRYDMGNTKRKFEYAVDLKPKADVQIRQEAMESARQTSVRHLEGQLGKTGFYFKIRKYPHHILRENPLASGAGADRVSTGMKQSFGKPIGSAIQITIGEKFMTVKVDKENILVAKTALQKASKKLPCSTSIVIEEIK